MLHPDQKQIIRHTFAQIAPIASLAGALFYSRLFELAPQTQPLFRYPLGTAGMARQSTKLMETLAVAVAHLDSLDRLSPALAELARRHVAYGAEPEHYEAVGAALLWTLEQGLGHAYTPEVAAAWGALYGAIADTMKGAAYSVT